MLGADHSTFRMRRMRSASRAPRCRSLDGVVSSMWVSTRPGPSCDEIVLPSGTAQLIVDGDTGAGLVVGPRTAPSVVRSARFAAGISLTAVGLDTLSRIPVQQLVDEVVDADAVMEPGRWVDCLERTDPAAVLDALEHETLRHVGDDRERHRFVAPAERAIRDGTPLDAVVAALGVDRRRLVPAFRDVVGLAPKHYQRVVRFQRAVRTMRTRTPSSLAVIAAGCGYADQAHMCREFKEFSGLTPRRLHGDSSTAPNHVEIDLPGAG